MVSFLAAGLLVFEYGVLVLNVLNCFARTLFVDLTASLKVWNFTCKFPIVMYILLVSSNKILSRYFC